VKLADFIRRLPESRRPTVAVPQADDPDAIRCIAHAQSEGLARFLLIGEPGRIRAVAAASAVDLADAEIVDEAGGEAAACARAAALVHAGRAGILMKGRVMTSTFTKAILDKANGLVPDGQLLSHVAAFEIPAYHKLLLITDAALNIQPGLEEKARILLNAVAFARGLGLDRPKVACLAPIEKVNPKIASTVDADALRTLAASGRFGACLVEGPLSLDVAVSRRAAETKGLASAVAGEVDVLLLPGLDAANVLYKSLTQFASARTASLVVGARVPVVLTSRADDEETKLLSVALAVHLAS
jgi:phosphate butyryltransferase